jgi:phycocyanobilin:ferredoxin oxidoreductase
VSSAFPFAALTRAAEERIVAALDLTPHCLPPHLANATGTWREMPVQIETRAYAGASVRYARFATVTSMHVQIGNVLCVPALETDLPILGADLVAVRQDTAMIAADISPVTRSGAAHAELLDTLSALTAAYADLPPGGELPAWCSDWFSPYPLYTRFAVEVSERAAGAFNAWVDTYLSVARRDAAHSNESLAIQRGYLRAHREDDKGLGMLAKMFGSEWAREYLQRVLFPTALEATP